MIPTKPVYVVAAMFAAQVLGMASFVTFPGLLPIFLEEWQLSNAEAGWISGVFFAGFVGAAPLLTAATDRIDPRRIYLFGIAVGVLANIGFAASADGFWSSTVWRFIQGVGFAGTYMPGLRAIGDAVPERMRNRAVAFYTATFTVGASFSFLISGFAIELLPWRAVFYVMASGPAVGFLLALLFLPPRNMAPATSAPVAGLARQFRKPVLLRYFGGYFLHNVESSAIRSFVVAFLAFSVARQQAGALGVEIAPTVIAAAANLLGLPGILLAGELTRFMKRDSVIAIIMLLSAATGVLLGVFAASPYWIVIVLMLLYGGLIPADVGAINAGVIENADSRFRGAALALHSVCGFTGAFLGPVIFGAALDEAGGETVAAAWVVGFAVMAAIILVWPIMTLIVRLRST